MSLTLICIPLKAALHTTGQGGSSAEVNWEKGSAGHMNVGLLEWDNVATQDGDHDAGGGDSKQGNCSILFEQSFHPASF
jgi:hypothetical protein